MRAVPAISVVLIVLMGSVACGSGEKIVATDSSDTASATPAAPGNQQPARVPSARANDYFPVNARLAGEAQRISQLARRQLGAYVCTVGLQRRGPDRVELYVTRGSRSAARRLMQDIARLPFRIRTASSDVSDAARSALFAELLKSLPTRGSSASVGIEEWPFNIRHCPRVVLEIPEVAAPSTEQWAADVIERYGTTRVAIRRYSGQIGPAIGG